MVEQKKVISIEERIPKLKQMRKKKTNRRLIFLLSFFFLLLICVLYFLSPISHVRSILVKGNKYITSEKVLSYAQIKKDESIWKIDREEIIRTLEKQREIQDANVSVRFPNKVIITIKEYDRIAYLSKESKFFPILSNSEILPPLKDGEIPVNAPVLFGFSKGPALKQLIEELEQLPAEINNSISEVHHKPKTTDPYHVQIFMNDGFEVSASSRTLSQKLIHYPSIVSQLDPKIKGVIDLEVGSYFRAYDTEEQKTEEKGRKDTDHESDG